MRKLKTDSETILLEQVINVSNDQIFDAWVNPDARSVWGVPSENEALEFLENDFREGGKDIHLCGERGDLRYKVETLYHKIEQHNLIVFTESVSSDNVTLCTSLSSVEFVSGIDTTTVKLQVHVVSFVGEEMIEGNRGGWNATLKNLNAYFAK